MPESELVIGEFENILRWQFDRAANIGRGITPDDITDTFADIREAHNRDMRDAAKVSFEMIEMQRKKIVELEAQLPKVSLPFYCVGPRCGVCQSSLFHSDVYCHGCGAKINWPGKCQ